MEVITLPNAVVQPDITTLQVAELNLNWKGGEIQIRLMSAQDPKYLPLFIYRDSDTPGNPRATNMMIALNKANLSGAGGSLHKRVIQQLKDDGFITGTISGSPD